MKKGGIETVPLGTVLENGALLQKGAIFSLKLLKYIHVLASKPCPKRYCFTDSQTMPLGHHFGATYFFESIEF